MTDYDDLAARAEAGKLRPISGTTLRGPAAADAGRQLLEAAADARSAPELHEAVMWVKVVPSEVAKLAGQRARLAKKDVKPQLLVELGVISGDEPIDIRDVLADEARRMIDVCETEEALMAYLADWARLVVKTPGRRARKRQFFPLPMNEEAALDYALLEAKRAATSPWGEREALVKWFASRPDSSADESPK
jgi:hypothetical protein